MAKIFNRNLILTDNSVLAYDRGTGTDVSQAVTIQRPMGRITSSTSNLGASTTEDITLTNRLIKADSMVICQVAGGGAGDVVVSRVAPAAGSCVITVLNADPAVACDAVYTIDYMILGAGVSTS